MIILVGGEKGGTGKTTIATNLAQMRASQGNDVLLIDTDKQQSASNWAALREEEGANPRIATIQKFGKNITKDIVDLSTRYKDIIIDAGGRDSHELRASMIVADELYIPLQASQFDIWTLQAMDDLVEQSQILNPKLKSYVILNRGSTNPSVSEINEAKDLVSDFKNLTFSGIILKDRIAYRKASSLGLGVVEMKPRDGKASDEVEHLYTNIFKERK